MTAKHAANKFDPSPAGSSSIHKMVSFFRTTISFLVKCVWKYSFQKKRLIVNLTLEIQRSSSHDCLSISQKTVTTVTMFPMDLRCLDPVRGGCGDVVDALHHQAANVIVLGRCFTRPGQGVVVQKAWLANFSFFGNVWLIDVQWFYKWLQTIPNSYCLDIYTVYTLQLSQFRNPKNIPGVTFLASHRWSRSRAVIPKREKSGKKVTFVYSFGALQASASMGWSTCWG